MYLKYIQIINFKNLKSVRFEFAKGANTIIGENDSGKSNALTAMRILLDDSYYYNTKRLKETDFSYALGDWKGHWIIISAFFDEISEEDKHNEFCTELTPDKENADFLRSYIRCEDKGYGTVSLFIRPCKSKRQELDEASQSGRFEIVRSQIKLSDYEFYYTARSQADFTNENLYKSIVGDISAGEYANPENDDSSVLGTKIDIMNVWQHVSTVFIDALRDVESELRKPKNPIRQIIDTIEGQIAVTDINDIKKRITELNTKISNIPQISDIGNQVNRKLLEMIGTVYSPDIKLESRLKEDFATLARYLTMAPSDQNDIDLLGLGHLNILYIALKLVEFEANRNRELLNIMIIEEPEAHIHTHIQKTLFDNLQVVHTYTQVVMSTHSTHLSEVADIEKVNIMKKVNEQLTFVMKPTNGLDNFGADVLKHRGMAFTQILSRYLDAKRSVLLFSKGVILVEGDGEEILIPALVKKVLGVSLDEMGIGLINVGSVAFENVACIFDETRLQRRCAIVTDLDAIVDGATKGSQEAMVIGAARKARLSSLFDSNPYVEPFYAPHTLEVDFADIEDNKEFIYSVINHTYTQKAARDKHIAAIKSGTAAARYDAVLTVAQNIQKGWYATLLASEIKAIAVIPTYILDAIAFATKDVVSQKLLWKMVKYSFDEYVLDSGYDDMKKEFAEVATSEQITDLISGFCREFPNAMVTAFIAKVGGLSD
jgi:predicted ATP-dependent endonuclease of OLD family